MELKEALEKRTSIRNFTNDPIPLEDIKELVRRASMAPSVNNYQPWKFYAITNQEMLNKLAVAVSDQILSLESNESKRSEQIKNQVSWYSTFFKDAPLMIALALEPYETVLEKGVKQNHEAINRMRNYPDIQSAGAAIQNLLLSSVDMGYGACWLSSPLVARDQINSIVGIEADHNLIAFVAIGKTEKDPQPKAKKEIDDILFLID